MGGRDLASDGEAESCAALTARTGIVQTREAVVTQVPGKPHHVRPYTPTPVQDLTVGEGTNEQPSLSEVPGAEPHDVQPVQPGDVTPVTDAPNVVGEEGHTLTRP